MLMPSIFGENLFDEWMDDFDREFFGNRNPMYGKRSTNMMKTDVRDTGDTYELDIDLPGFKKDEITAELKDGYLTINASSNTNNDEKDEKGRYIRRERYSGSCCRSFYVGDEVTQEDVKAKFENGTLTLTIPKKEQKPAVEENKYIAIEG